MTNEEFEKMEKLIRFNERMKTALLSIHGFARSCTIGGWRQRVADLAGNGLRDD